MPQDMPPTGATPKSSTSFMSSPGPAESSQSRPTFTPRRNLPARGFKPWVYMVGMHAIMAYGFYKYFHGVREQRELSREKMWSRLYLTPLLQAEEDRDQVRRYYADQARAKELGIEDKVYNSDRFIRPTFAITPSQVTQ
ncbi:hypothetical protein N7507_009463 [Penicillium longicatenatum]|nr:hypothetical protein N7507_009463 [Penicillium longicatenatum]